MTSRVAYRKVGSGIASVMSFAQGNCYCSRQLHLPCILSQAMAHPIAAGKLIAGKEIRRCWRASAGRWGVRYPAPFARWYEPLILPAYEAAAMVMPALEVSYQTFAPKDKRTDSRSLLHHNTDIPRSSHASISSVRAETGVRQE